LIFLVEILQLINEGISNFIAQGENKSSSQQVSENIATTIKEEDKSEEHL
jgi:hypothetical protein